MSRTDIPQAFALDSLERIVKVMQNADAMLTATPEIDFDVTVWKDGEILGVIQIQDGCLCFVANGDYFGFVPGSNG
jgi:hypothetical protein